MNSPSSFPPERPAASTGNLPQRRDARAASLVRRLDGRSIVLVGIMGSGKTSVGRRLAARLGMPPAARSGGMHRPGGERGGKFGHNHPLRLAAAPAAGQPRG